MASCLPSQLDRARLDGEPSPDRGASESTRLAAPGMGGTGPIAKSVLYSPPAVWYRARLSPRKLPGPEGA
jgi:hypothetical protein